MSESKNILDEICARKREHIAERKKIISPEEIRESAQTASAPRGFADALKNSKQPAIIAEIKKASPSVGIIRPDFDLMDIAMIYQESGAACISVLTDEPYFQGRDEYIGQVKRIVKLPVLRKDFILEEYQVYESRMLGADCILLIMAALDETEAHDLHQLSGSLGMDVLVEIHDEEELHRAMELAPAMIGINNRNLKTLQVDVRTSHELAKKIPSDVLKIAESGISDIETIRALQKDGFDGFLIGESLMKQRDIGAALKKFTAAG